MKNVWRLNAILGAGMLVVLSPVFAGEIPQRPDQTATRMVQASSGVSDSAVTVRLFQFRPTPLEVKAGTRVTWTNDDDITHTVTSGLPDSKDGRFDSPLRGKGATFGLSFDAPGTYPYFCNRHQSMRGEIRVR
jgi:plastocyanin